MSSFQGSEENSITGTTESEYQDENYESGSQLSGFQGKRSVGLSEDGESVAGSEQTDISTVSESKVKTERGLNRNQIRAVISRMQRVGVSKSKSLQIPTSFLVYLIEDELRKAGLDGTFKTLCSDEVRNNIGYVTNVFMMEVLEEARSLCLESKPDGTEVQLTPDIIHQAFKRLREKKTYPAITPKKKMFRFE